MKTTWTRSEALRILLNVDGVYKAGVCKEDDSWFVKKDLISLRNFIFESTEFLNEILPTFKLRMLCFKLNLMYIVTIYQLHNIICQNLVIFALQKIVSLRKNLMLQKKLIMNYQRIKKMKDRKKLDY